MQWAKDPALILQQLTLLLWYRFDAWPKTAYCRCGQKKKRPTYRGNLYKIMEVRGMCNAEVETLREKKVSKVLKGLVMIP